MARLTLPVIIIVKYIKMDLKYYHKRHSRQVTMKPTLSNEQQTDSRTINGHMYKVADISHVNIKTDKIRCEE